jgi:transposase-like protein
MTKPFSVAFKQKMVERLTGKNAVSATQLARETGVNQQNLSRWLQEARGLPLMAGKPKPVRGGPSIRRYVSWAKLANSKVRSCPLTSNGKG